jgi:hypothetical protein
MICIVSREMEQRHQDGHDMSYPWAVEANESIAQNVPGASLQVPSRLMPTRSLIVAPNDVLCGKGRESFQHGQCLCRFLDSLCESVQPMYFLTTTSPGNATRKAAGNERFRDSVAAALPEYQNDATERDKGLVAQAIINEIWISGGRFLRKDDRARGTWHELEETQTRDKVGRALRDACKRFLTEKRGRDGTKRTNAERASIRLLRLCRRAIQCCG